MSDLADRIREEASIAARPGQFGRLTAIAEAVERLEATADTSEPKPCGSCGVPTTYTSRAHIGVPACLRHRGHWRTPAPDYTCPTACVEQNHPGIEHHDWLTRSHR